MGRIHFLGGADTVTGSKFLVEAASGASLLVDCGIFQGPREVRDLNWDDPFVDCPIPDSIVLTHAHIDHTGFVPRLVGTHGFGGPIRCTEATADLLSVMLPDSGRLQEEQAAYANKKGYSRHKPALPLYNEADAYEALDLLSPVPYDEWIDVPEVGRMRLVFAGHILGSAHVEMESDGARLVFSGDVGRWDMPIIRDPAPPAAADLTLLESTYGGRRHPEFTADPSDQLADLVNTVARRGGVMVIPAFSIGRTQEVLFRLRELEDEDRIPRLPVIVDSPMAIDATEMYIAHRQEHDIETSDLMAAGKNAIRPHNMSFSRSVEESKALNSVREPIIIISASGMATGGRVPHHLKRRLPWPENLVVFVGYQAQGTPGRLLVDGADAIRIHGEEVEVRAQVTRLEAMSAHADEDELVRWLSGSVPARVALVHGEQDARADLTERLHREFHGIEVLQPMRGDVVDY